MHYYDFSPEDQAIVDEFLRRYNEQDRYGGIYPEDLRDDEIFFRTKDELLEVVAELDEKYTPESSYGEIVRKLAEYFNGAEYDVDDFDAVYLGWARIARVGDGRYLIMSDSWSDSGVFLNR